MEEKTNTPMLKRLISYFGGLFIMTIGIAFSVKSNLGVSPVSSIPYTLTCCWGIEMGRATILLHCALVILQIIILRKDFKIRQLLQIPVGVVFGLFTTLCNNILGYLPDVSSYVIRIFFTLISAFFIALGIFIYLPANIVPLAGEGFMQSVAYVTRIDFPKVKIATDVSMVALSLITCLIVLHGMGSVGAGTIIAAFLVGTILGQITKLSNKIRKKKAKSASA